MNQHNPTRAAPLALMRPIRWAAISRAAAAPLVGYFTEPTHPLNLAVVRVVIFGACLAQFNWNQLIWFSGLPRVLLFPPHSLAWLVPYVPITPQLATAASVLFIGGCVLGCIGLFTRWAALTVVISGLVTANAVPDGAILERQTLGQYDATAGAEVTTPSGTQRYADSLPAYQGVKDHIGRSRAAGSEGV